MAKTRPKNKTGGLTVKSFVKTPESSRVIPHSINQLYKKSIKQIMGITDPLSQTTGPLESLRALYLNISAEFHILKRFLAVAFI